MPITKRDVSYGCDNNILYVDCICSDPGHLIRFKMEFPKEGENFKDYLCEGESGLVVETQLTPLTPIYSRIYNSIKFLLNIEYADGFYTGQYKYTLVEKLECVYRYVFKPRIYEAHWSSTLMSINDLLELEKLIQEVKLLHNIK